MDPYELSRHNDFSPHALNTQHDTWLTGLQSHKKWHCPDGGGALLPGLDKRLAGAMGLKVSVADDPTHATIRGVSVVLDELDFLSKKASK